MSHAGWRVGLTLADAQQLVSDINALQGYPTPGIVRATGLPTTAPQGPGWTLAHDIPHQSSAPGPARYAIELPRAKALDKVPADVATRLLDAWANKVDDLPPEYDPGNDNNDPQG